jgi:endonuclease-8
MPEGHTIHRAARLQTKRFVGTELAVSSPQGRFDDGAALLDGQVIEEIDAWGKHLFYRWDHGHVMHVHLGLFGKFRIHTDDPPPPTDGTRLQMVSDKGTLYLSGPTDCSVIDPGEEERIVSGLGPDPLRNKTHVGAVAHMETFLSRRTVPIGAALLDQSVICGIGNVYRAEILFRLGINPHIESRDVPASDIGRLWNESVANLRRGEKSGRIVTTDPEDVGRTRRSDIARGERTYVYKRNGQPCRRCDTPIERTDMKGRKIWWCPSCQAA